MNRSPRAFRWMAPGLLLMVVAAVVAVLSPTAVDAQDNTPASLSLVVSPDDATKPFRTLAVALDVGDSGLAALGATIRFDPDLIVGGSCSVSEVGACNVTDDGRIRMSVFSLSRLRSNDQLLTVNFEPAPDARGTTTFELIVDTAVSSQAAPLPTIVEGPITVALTSDEYGSLTGDVIDSESAVGLFALNVCVTNDDNGAETCTTSSGLGTWRIDELPVGDYTVSVTDPAGAYASGTSFSTVTADTITAGIVTTMVLATDEAETDDDAVSIDEEPDIELPAAVIPQATAPITIVYDASITGRVSALDSAKPAEAKQVCATQPLVLHQSCATTDANGMFSLSGLSTGNYWIEVIDPLGQLEQTRPKLVGVVGDDVTRAGVNITLTAVAE